MGNNEELINTLAKGNLKPPSQIINKAVLDGLIEDNEELYNFLSLGTTHDESYYRFRVGLTLKHLRILKQRLGYEE